MALIGNWPAYPDPQTHEPSGPEAAWFTANPVAWRIANGGTQQMATAKPAAWNMQCLLSNMCDYGKLNWRYEPGSRVNVDSTLQGNWVVTDCESLAKVFCAIADHLGFKATPREITRPGYRIVTKPGIVTFNGKTGDQSLEGRWCFGNHWVAEVDNLCYDPTFNFKGFSFAQAANVYLGWYARDVRDPKAFASTVWKADPAVPGSRDVYLRQIPDVAYTFTPTDLQGKEKAEGGGWFKSK
jgi:hypothetical protein